MKDSNDPKVAVVFDLDPGLILASSPEKLGKLMKDQYNSQERQATYIRWETKTNK